MSDAFAPSAKPWQVSIEPNISSGYFEAERSRLFKHVWFQLGRVEVIPNPGDYFVRQIDVLGASVIVSRGRDGVLRAFHNICRHRGNRVVKQAAGSAKAFSCGFHGWTYNSEGALVNIPLEQEFRGCDKADLSLIPLAIEVWEGFIFVHLNIEPEESLRDYLQPVAGLLDGFPFAEMELSGWWSARLASNWKTFQDAFIEAYHVLAVHRRSIPDFRSDPIVPTAQSLGRHCKLTYYQNLHHEPKPAEAMAFELSSLAFLNAGDANELKTRRWASLNFERRDNWVFDEFVIFPNFHLFLGDGWMLCHEFWPVDVDHTDWHVKYYQQRTTSPTVRIAQEYSKVAMRDAIREDLSTIESTHAAQRSGAMPFMTLSPSLDALIIHHHGVVAEYVGARLTGIEP
ncbi:MAG: aromatic ring-hydroxylating dioxygenase subunit alpha [Candidatus Binataceae bacterium]|nr:aromatic ring-hydroxylating dioxygenase subunit alpha [Candidatus Binataceae bacterium]